MAENTDESGAKRSGTVAGVVLGALIVYIVSFGPLVWLINLTGFNNQSVLNVLEVLYCPHILLARLWEPYMAYIDWWASLA